jgi:flagellar assembly protein FliH
MPVVKAQQTHHLQNTAIAMDLGDLEEHARNIIKKAQAQAGTIIQNAREQSTADAQVAREESRRAGHEEGYKAGLEQGMAAGREQASAQHKPALEQLVARWQQTLTVLQQNLPSHLADARTDLVRLALEIAGVVTRQEAVRNANVVKANVDASLALVTAGRKVTLVVHPDEVKTIEDYLPELLAAFKNVSAVELQADPSVEAGGCITRFGAGQVDGRLETQIQRIAAELLAKEI